MITPDELKRVLARDHGRLSKVLATLATLGKPSRVQEITQLSADSGFRKMREWNVSSILATSRGKAILINREWEITPEGEADVSALLGFGVSNKPPMAATLRAELAKITNPTTHAFAEEAVKCFEAALYRSAIVMSWLSAVDILYRHVVQHHLAAFNSEATAHLAKSGKSWKKAKNEDDLALMGERDFLDRLAALSIIGKNVKTELVKCLDLRNGCGHPNSLVTGPNAVAHHVEVLLQNVFQRFV